MSFVEVQFPVEVSAGARGGPMFKTSVFQAASGFEQRNIEWSKSRAVYDVAPGIKNYDDMESVRAFFYARRGKAYGFRFKDWSDFILERQNIGTGDSSDTTFQIFKRYTSGGVNYDRNLTKIVSGSVLVWVNNVSQGSGWSVNNNTGVITFTVPPTTGHAIEASCQFDVPVRFDTDEFPVEAIAVDASDGEGTFSIDALQLVEVRI